MTTSSPAIPEFDLPRAIWMPESVIGTLPRCYQGSPLEMVRQMAFDMNPTLGVHEAIDFLIQALIESGRTHIDIPGAETPEDGRARIFIGALLVSGLARPMASA